MPLTPPPAALPPLAAPEPGHYFHLAEDAYAAASDLDANALGRARDVLAEAYAAVALIRGHLRCPLPGCRRASDAATADVLDELLRGLVDADGNSTGYALGQVDEAAAWLDVPEAPPLLALMTRAAA